MHSLQIVPEMLKEYTQNKIGDARIKMLKAQAKEQLEKIKANEALLSEYLDDANLESVDEVDEPVLWILFFANEFTTRSYVKNIDDTLDPVVPVSDISDLFVYLLYRTKVEGDEIKGFEHLIDEEGQELLEEIDHNIFTNMIVFVQQKREGNLSF